MSDRVPLHEALEGTVAKMSSSVTNDGTWYAEARKDVGFDELNDNLVVIGLARHCLHPLGDVIHSQEDVQISKGIWKWAHEVDAPHIKDFHHLDWVEGHHIPLGDPAHLLAPITACTKGRSILEE